MDRIIASRQILVDEAAHLHNCDRLTYPQSLLAGSGFSFGGIGAILAIGFFLARLGNSYRLGVGYRIRDSTAAPQ